MQKNENNKNIRCSFCGKTQDSVEKIVFISSGVGTTSSSTVVYKSSSSS